MKVELHKIINITAGKFHCWCDSSVGKIRKLNNVIPDRLWNEFHHVVIQTISKIPVEIPIRLNWLQRLWNQIKKIFTCPHH